MARMTKAEKALKARANAAASMAVVGSVIPLMEVLHIGRLAEKLVAEEGMTDEMLAAKLREYVSSVRVKESL
jgi:hypothetical protein